MDKQGNDKVFYRITNKDIYREILGLHKKIDKINGSAKITRLIAAGAMGLSIITIGVVKLL